MLVSRYVVLLSGGMDSVLNLLISRELGEVALALTVDYGQRAAVREVERSSELCRRVGVRHNVLDLTWLGVISGSALTWRDRDRHDPAIHADAVDSLWVPNRNGLLANVGACYAEALGAQYVVMGLNSEEAEVFPDNTRGFVEAINLSLAFSTLSKVRLVSHTLDWDKERIIKELLARDFDFCLLWSCYNGGSRMCGKCPSCLRLLRSAEKTGIISQIETLFGDPDIGA